MASEQEKVLPRGALRGGHAQLHLHAPPNLAAVDPGGASRLQRLPGVVRGACPELSRVPFQRGWRR